MKKQNHTADLRALWSSETKQILCSVGVKGWWSIWVHSEEWTAQRGCWGFWHNSAWLAAFAQERPQAGWWRNFHYRVQTRSAACREQQQEVLVPKAFVLLNVCFCILLICFNQRNVFQLLTAMCTEVIKTVEKITSHVQVKKKLRLSTASKII